MTRHIIHLALASALALAAGCADARWRVEMTGQVITSSSQPPTMLGATGSAAEGHPPPKPTNP